MAKWEIVAYVPTYKGEDAGNNLCSNFSGIAGNKGSSELWAVKVNSANDKAVLYYFENLANGSYTQCVVNNVFGHAGGISCSPKNLFIGCRWVEGEGADKVIHNKYVARIPIGTARSLTGTKDKAYFTGKGYLANVSGADALGGVGTLSYFGTDQLFVRDNNYATVGEMNRDGYDKFCLLKYENGKYAKIEKSEFYTYIPSNYRGKIEHNQGFFYDKSAGYLYTIYNLKNGADSQNPIDNRIFVYDMNGSYTTKDKRKCYQKMHTITMNPDGKPDNADYSKLEIESACLDKDGKLLLCGNIKIRVGSKNEEQDMIIRVKGFDPANPTPN